MNKLLLEAALFTKFLLTALIAPFAAGAAGFFWEFVMTPLRAYDDWQDERTKRGLAPRHADRFAR